MSQRKLPSQCTLWTALITPFDEHKQIDFTSLQAIAIEQADTGNGILLLGSTGEGLALTPQEQLSIVNFVCLLQLNTPLMVAVGGYNLAEQTEWIKQCNKLNIDAYLLGTPLYAKPGVIGQTQWFSHLLETAQFPCMLYNVPSRSGVEIPVETVKQLQNHKNCWAMKEASGDLNQFLRFRQHCPNVELFTGEDAMLPYLAPAGAKGLVSVCANAWPQATKHYVDLCIGDNTALTQIQCLFPLWNNAVDALFSVANPIPVKVLMQQKGSIATPWLRAPLTHEELIDTQPLLAFDEKIKQWHSESLKQEQAKKTVQQIELINQENLTNHKEISRNIA
ncbi:MAG: 4-hydroxy-tetrahydrodipicolinate synthase [Colwellia sp.]